MSKYDHLKLKIVDSEFKYVLLKNKEDLTDLVVKSSDLPIALFSGDGEVSAIVPSNIECDSVKAETEWICLRIIGEMPFGTVQGLIAEISGILANHGMGICVVSTFLTDWFFVKAKNKDRAISDLKTAGWKFAENE